MKTELSGRHPGRAARGRGGFSLLEIMLVVLIIGILATVVIVNLGGASDTTKITVTKAKLSQLKGALTQYYAKEGQYPTTLDELAMGSPPILERVPTDGWKSAFVYYHPSTDPTRDFTLYSPGKDKLLNTPDDISVWDVDD